MATAKLYPDFQLGGGSASLTSTLFKSQELPRWLSGKESACQCRRCKTLRFDPWVRKTPWRRKLQATPVFLPGKSHRQKEPGGLQSTGLQRVGHNRVAEHAHIYLSIYLFIILYYLSIISLLLSTYFTEI